MTQMTRAERREIKKRNKKVNKNIRQSREQDFTQSIPENALNKSHFNLKPLSPKTQTQAEFFHEFNMTRNHIILSGFAGVGKTACAVYSGLNALQDNQFKKIVIIRSAVPTRDLGHLPGSLNEKAEIYELPYKQLLNQFYGRDDAYGIFKKYGLIEFLTTSYVRGITLKDAVVICDEFNNFTAHELDSVVTRLGEGCRLLICGDFLQTDFTRDKEKDVHKVIEILKRMNNVVEFVFDENDIVRSGLVRDYIKAKSRAFPQGF